MLLLPAPSHPPEEPVASWRKGCPSPAALLLEEPSTAFFRKAAELNARAQILYCASSCRNRLYRSYSTQSSASLSRSNRPMMITVHFALRPVAGIPAHSLRCVASQVPRHTPLSPAKKRSFKV